MPASTTAAATKSTNSNDMGTQSYVQGQMVLEEELGEGVKEDLAGLVGQEREQEEEQSLHEHHVFHYVRQTGWHGRLITTTMHTTVPQAREMTN